MEKRNGIDKNGEKNNDNNDAATSTYLPRKKTKKERNRKRRGKNSVKKTDREAEVTYVRELEREQELGDKIAERASRS